MLAGDVAAGVDVVEYFGDWPVPVVYVAGNHEFYGREMPQTRKALRDACSGMSIHFLDEDVFDLGAVRFLGATLWTDYQLRSNRTQQHVMEQALSRLNDHSLILTAGSLRFSPANALAEHEKSRAWLERELGRNHGGKTVVVTHHGPHPLSIHARYAGDPLNGAFVSNLEPLLGRADLWLHGHVHDAFDYRLGRCRVVANPLGYPRNVSAAADAKDLVFENQAFNWACVIDV